MRPFDVLILNEENMKANKASDVGYLKNSILSHENQVMKTIDLSMTLPITIFLFTPRKSSYQYFITYFSLNFIFELMSNKNVICTDVGKEKLNIFL